jgi:hypothetical protein
MLAGAFLGLAEQMLELGEDLFDRGNRPASLTL